MQIKKKKMIKVKCIPLFKKIMEMDHKQTGASYSNNYYLLPYPSNKLLSSG